MSATTENVPDESTEKALWKENLVVIYDVRTVNLSESVANIMMKKTSRAELR